MVTVPTLPDAKEFMMALLPQISMPIKLRSESIFLFFNNDHINMASATTPHIINVRKRELKEDNGSNIIGDIFN